MTIGERQYFVKKLIEELEKMKELSDKMQADAKARQRQWR
jgi:hypothetical protein